LLIRPFATKPSVAGFYFKEAGAFERAAAPLLEFPFRRRDLGQAEPPASQSRIEEPAPAPDIIRHDLRTEPAVPVTTATASAAPAASPVPILIPVPSRRSWPALPIILLLVGVLLGYQAALNIRPNTPPASYDLALTVTQTGADLRLKWDRQSPAIRISEKGIVTIQDGTYNKATILSPAELERGSLPPYRTLTKHVVFRLAVFPNPQNSISETVEWPAPEVH
jgi:hypothetical protein